MKQLLFALALVAGCGSGDALEGACSADRDCPDNAHCIAGTGVCERFTNPLDPLGALGDDGGAHNRSATDSGTGG